MKVIERTTIPVLAVFGGRDTQVDPHQGVVAYRAALRKAGNPHSRVELVPDTDHNILLSETGCIAERESRSTAGWKNYPQEYLDLIEEWLTSLKAATGRS
jgi:pimeloyl-ACP methyl ester carboxylesterase